MVKISAGLLMYRLKNKSGKKGLELFLVHPGGPFWKNKDLYSWSIPKGEISNNTISDESLLKEAKREFYEETGIKINSEKFIKLGKIKQKSGKEIYAWAFEKNWQGFLRQNFITINFYRKKIKIPEIDKAQYFSIDKAKEKINPAQFEFIKRLKEKIYKLL